MESLDQRTLSGRHTYKLQLHHRRHEESAKPFVMIGWEAHSLSACGRPIDTIFHDNRTIHMVAQQVVASSSCRASTTRTAVQRGQLRNARVNFPTFLRIITLTLCRQYIEDHAPSHCACASSGRRRKEGATWPRWGWMTVPAGKQPSRRSRCWLIVVAYVVVVSCGHDTVPRIHARVVWSIYLACTHTAATHERTTLQN